MNVRSASRCAQRVLLLGAALLACTLSSLAQGPALFRPGDLPTGLVGWWKLDEPSGPRADSSGSGNQLQDAGGVASLAEDYWATGEQSADFEAADSEGLTRGITNSGLDFSGPDARFTIAAWVKVESHPTAKRTVVAQVDDAAHTGYGFEITDTGELALRINSRAADGANSPAGVVQTGKWQHVAVSLDSTTDTAAFYVDGNLVGVRTNVTANILPSTMDFALGRRPDVNTHYFDGLMKDAAVWNRTLAPQEVKSLALGTDLQAFGYRPGDVSVVPTAWWKLNELSSGSSAVARQDSVGNHPLTDNNTVASGAGFVEGAGADLVRGNAEYFTAADSTDWDFGSGDFTVSLWARPRTLGVNQDFLTRNDLQFRIGLDTSNNFVWWIEGFERWTRVPSGFAVGAWQHIVVRRTGTSLRVFKDGVPIGIAGTSSDTIVTTGLLNLGRNDSGVNHFDGQMSDVAIWKGYALSDVEIKALATGLPVQRAGVVSYWNLDGPDAGTGKWNDSLGGNHLTPSASAPGGAAGVVGGAADFERDNNQFLSIADALQSGLDITRDFTVMAWARPESTSALTFLDKNGESYGYNLNTLIGTAYSMDVAGESVVSTTQASVGAWQHIIGVQDGAQKSIWIDSRKEAFNAQTTATRDTTTDFFLGRHFSIASRNWDGLLDEVLVARRWFREEEIKTIYNKGLAGYAATSLTGPPTVQTLVPSPLAATEATLRGAVEANGGTTTWYFEYGLTTAYGTTTTTRTLAGTAVSEPIAGLSAVTTYHCRLVAENEHGITYGPDQTFTSTGRPPLATAADASDLATEAATLNADVTPFDTATGVVFEWGLAPAFDNTTPVQMLAGDGVPKRVSAALSGLQPATQYQFRTRATNASGEVVTSAQNFTTASRLPLATTSAAGNVGTMTTQLRAMVTPRDTSTAVVFEWGSTVAYGSETPVQVLGPGSTAVAVAADLGGLTENSIYHCRVKATNGGGTTLGSDVVFTTLPPPPGVTNLAALNITNAGATLRADVNANGAVTTGYFEYGTTTNYGGQTAVIDVGAGSSAVPVSALITGLVANNTYFYRFVGTNAGGTTTSGDASFLTVSAGNFPPAAATGGASAVTTTTATLHAAVNPNGGATTTYFEYGTTTAYGFRTPTPDLNIGNGTSALGLSEPVADLLPNTLYHFRVVAENPLGMTEGLDSTFLTKPLPPVVVTGTASSVAFNAATLGGTVNPSGVAATAYFEWGPDTNYGNQTPVQNLASATEAGSVAAAIGGLAADATYHFRLVSENVGGRTLGADQTLTTAPPPPSATTVAADTITPSSMTLRGTVNPNGLATDGYFEYGPTQSLGSSTARVAYGSGTDAVSASAVLSGLVAGGQVYFRFVAENASGTNAGNPLAATTLATPPTVSTGGVTDVFQAKARLHGTVNPNGFTTRGFFEYRAGSGAWQPTRVLGFGSVPGVQTPFEDVIGLTAGTQHDYRFVAERDGTRFEGSVETFTTLPPLPEVATVGEKDVTTVSATLQASVDPNGTATDVHFEWSAAQNLAGATSTTTQPVGSGDDAVAVEQAIVGLAPNTRYYYRAVATNAGGTRPGLTASFTTKPLPADVTTGGATLVTLNSATLGGTVNANGVSGAAFFEYGETTAYDKTVSVPNPITGTGLEDVSAVVAALLPVTEYHYRLVVNTSGGRSEGEDMKFTTSASAAPVAVPDVIFHNGQVTFEPLLNDTDADEGDAAGLTIVSPLDVVGLPGRAESADGNHITYDVDGPRDVASFRYAAMDAHGAISAPATVTLVHYGNYKGYYQNKPPQQAQPAPQIAVGPRLTVVIGVDLDDRGNVLTGQLGKSAFQVLEPNSFGTRTGLGAQKLSGNLGPYGKLTADFTVDRRYPMRIELDLSDDPGTPEGRRITGSVAITDGGITYTAPLNLIWSAQAPQPQTSRSVGFIDSANAAAASRARGMVNIPGDGFLTMNIGKDRLRGARFVGRLPDAQPFSAGDRRPTGATYRLATSKLYQRGGKSHGRLEGNVEALGIGGVPLGHAAELDWEKEPDPASTYYRDGISERIFVEGIPYPKLAKSELVPIGLSPALLNATLRLSDGNLPGGALRDIFLSIFPTRAVVAGYVPGTTGGETDLTRMKLTLIPRTGLFSGRFIHPATGNPVKFQGAFRPAFGSVPGEGRGSFSGQTESGSIRILVNAAN